MKKRKNQSFVSLEGKVLFLAKTEGVLEYYLYIYIYLEEKYLHEVLVYN